jgi:transposase-like protein
MPQKRYYCDHCDKSFILTSGARRRHFDGRSHRNNVRMYYASFEGTSACTSAVHAALPSRDQNRTAVPGCAAHSQ